jgi:hypothetical protein
MKPNDRVQLKVRIARAQRDRLSEVAAERGVTAGSLVREQIGILTGEADPLRVKNPRSRRTKT